MSTNECALYAESNGKPKLNDLIALRLSPELLEGLQNGELQFKASDTESFICTKDKTFRLSGSSCNPTVCLLHDDRKDGDAFCLGTAVKTNLIADQCAGWIDWDTVPIYTGSSLSAEESLDSLKKRSFCSPAEFEKLWKEKGVLVNGNACVLEYDVLYKLATELNSAIFQCGSEDYDIIYESTSKSFPESLYRAVHARFWPGNKLTQFIGLNLLEQMQTSPHNAFLTRWKRDLLGQDPSLELLSGHYIDLGTRIQYIDQTALDKNPRQRLNYLLKFKPDWSLHELLPFYADLCDVNEKRSAEAYIKSFAKVVNTSDPKKRGGVIKKVLPIH